MRKTSLIVCVFALVAVLSTGALANFWDGPERPGKYEYSRELFDGSFPVVNGQVDLLLIGNRVVGDGASRSEDVIFVPAGEKVRFHVTSLDCNYVVLVKENGNTNPLLDFGVTGGGEGAGTLTRGLGLKEVRDLVLLKNGTDRVGSPVELVPVG